MRPRSAVRLRARRARARAARRRAAGARCSAAASASSGELAGGPLRPRRAGGGGRGARGRAALGAVEPLGRERQPARQRERLAAAGRARAADGRSAARSRVELHRGAGGAGQLHRRAGERRSRWVVMQHQAAARDQPLEQRHGERRALLGIGAGAELVEQHQALRTGQLPRLLEPQQPAAEGGAVGEQVLLVADRRDQRCRARHLAAGARPAPAGRTAPSAPAGPTVLSATVLPPALGPVTTSTRRSGVELEVERHDRAGRAARCRATRSRSGASRGSSSGWRAATRRSAARRRELRQIGRRPRGEALRRLEHVELADEPGELRAPAGSRQRGSRNSSASRRRRSASCSSHALLQACCSPRPPRAARSRSSCRWPSGRARARRACRGRRPAA